MKWYRLFHLQNCQCRYHTQAPCQCSKRWYPRLSIPIDTCNRHQSSLVRSHKNYLRWWHHMKIVYIDFKSNRLKKWTECGFCFHTWYVNVTRRVCVHFCFNRRVHQNPFFQTIFLQKSIKWMLTPFHRDLIKNFTLYWKCNYRFLDFKEVDII